VTAAAIGPDVAIGASEQLSEDIARDQYSSTPAWYMQGVVTPGDLKPLRNWERVGGVVVVYWMSEQLLSDIP